MKMTIVTDADGNVLGAVQGHALTEKKGGVEATVEFAQGSCAHMVDVDDDLSTIDDVDEFQQRLRHHVHQHQQQRP